MSNESFVHMTQYQLFMCCVLFLHADNSMPSNVDPASYSAWLDQGAQAMGYTSWLDFYHAYEVPNGVPTAPEVPTVNLPDEHVG